MGISKKGVMVIPDILGPGSTALCCAPLMLHNSSCSGWAAPVPQDFEAMEKQSILLAKSSLRQQIPELTKSAG